MADLTSAEPPGAPSGRIEVSERAIIAVVQDAVTSCYGVVAFAPRSLGAAIGRRLGRSTKPAGIEVSLHEGGVAIRIALVLQYGTPIFMVAKNVMQTVRFQVEQTLGLTVERVDVHVGGLRVSTEGEPTS